MDINDYQTNAEKNNHDNIERLRICDPNKVSSRIKFASFPKCPTPKDYDKGQRSIEGGTVLTFKPNLVKITARGYRCYIVRSVRRTVTNHIGLSVSKPSNWEDIDEKRPVTPEACRKWKKEKRCTVHTKHYRITDHYSTLFSALQNYLMYKLN